MHRTHRRLLLFDIDGTLLHGGPLWKECFEAAILQIFPGFSIPKIHFSGKTDGQICRELLLQGGASRTGIEAAIHEVLTMYLRLAREGIKKRAHEIAVLPGVQRLLESLAENPRCSLALLTGNLEQGALLKLEGAGLGGWFEWGAYADDHWDRYELPTVAARRAEEKLGIRFERKQIVIIGDTIHDVGCGRSIGARSIAVGTGTRIDQDELRAAQPDFYFPDLSDTDLVTQAVFQELPG